MSQTPKIEPKDTVTTAVDYLDQQNELEREARELMPYEPNECTFIKGELRQPVFACLSCSRDNHNQPIGVCYSCSIQCHSSHEIVELFSKRDFVCDCGTTRMKNTKNGACKIRSKVDLDSFTPRTGSSQTGSSQTQRSWGSNIDSEADDIPGTNSYNHNFKGKFCSCEEPYNPLEETRNMIQCYFGFACGEDWFHEDCILGYGKSLNDHKSSGNILHELSEPGEDAAADASIKQEKEKTESSVFPDLEAFDVFICWKCVLKFDRIFKDLQAIDGVVFSCLPHLNVNTKEEWNQLNTAYQNDEPKNKRVKLEQDSVKEPPRSVCLNFGFRDKLNNIKVTAKGELASFLENHSYLYLPDPVYEPPEDDDNSSTFELGTEALLSLPRDQAIEGLQAFDQVRSKLRDFLRPFANENKIVTEEEVRTFFSNIKKEDK